MRRLRALWQSAWGDVDRRIRLGRLLGLIFLAAGFLVIGKAWDGAAAQGRVDSQLPYLLSGGFMGLGLIVTGATLLLLATARSERQVLTDKWDQMTTLLGRNLSRLQFSSNGQGSSGEQVVAGSTAYHRIGCKVLEGKDGLMTVSLEQAAAEGLVPCRVCDPPELRKEEPVTAGSETPAP